MLYSRSRTWRNWPNIERNFAFLSNFRCDKWNLLNRIANTSYAINIAEQFSLDNYNVNATNWGFRSCRCLYFLFYLRIITTDGCLVYKVNLYSCRKVKWIINDCHNYLYNLLYLTLKIFVPHLALGKVLEQPRFVLFQANLLKLIFHLSNYFFSNSFINYNLLKNAIPTKFRLSIENANSIAFLFCCMTKWWFRTSE